MDTSATNPNHHTEIKEVILIKLYPKEQASQYLIIDILSIVFLITMVLTTDSGLSIIAKFLLLAGILFSFYSALWNRDWRLFIACFIGLAFLMFISLVQGSIMLTFGFMFADSIGRAQSKWHIGIIMGMIASIFVSVSWIETGHLFQAESPYLWAIMVVQVLYPALIHYIEKSKKLQNKLVDVNRQLIQEEERRRIARDLHDTLGHSLTMMKLKLELTSKLVEKDPSRVQHELNDVLSTTRSALKEVREIVSDMNFISLNKELLHTEMLLKKVGVSIQIRHHCTDVILSSVEETMLSLCIREATTNILKHSQAKRCQLELTCQQENYQVAIIDNGIGLFQQGRGNGISSMKERMNALEGKATIANYSPVGTILTLQFPLHQHRKGELIL